MQVTKLALPPAVHARHRHSKLPPVLRTSAARQRGRHTQTAAAAAASAAGAEGGAWDSELNRHVSAEERAHKQGAGRWDAPTDDAVHSPEHEADDAGSASQGNQSGPDAPLLDRLLGGREPTVLDYVALAVGGLIVAVLTPIALVLYVSVFNIATVLFCCSAPVLVVLTRIWTVLRRKER